MLCFSDSPCSLLKSTDASRGETGAECLVHLSGFFLPLDLGPIIPNCLLTLQYPLTGFKNILSRFFGGSQQDITSPFLVNF